MVAERGAPRKNVQSYRATDSIANEEATSEYGRVHRSREISTTRSSRVLLQRYRYRTALPQRGERFKIISTHLRCLRVLPEDRD